MEMPIVLTEYPKSGGSWITSLIGDALNVPKRDIYVRPGFDLFDTSDHPWYKNGAAHDFPTQSVVKSHELPDSKLIDFEAKYLHLVRDGRDVIVSRWFFDKDFLVKNGITASFDKNFDDYVEEKAIEWSRYVLAWASTSTLTIRYEDFLADPETALGSVVQKISGTTLSPGLLADVVGMHTKEKFARSLSNTFKHNTFVRKGISGDWKNHFSRRNSDSFASIAHDAMSLLGYAL
ncbi:sulfotransferase domain-containing protein [Paraburkholderia adhaesiva]|uniref:sulfotransferase domain-containing protein n=1 Tax=Paraburkholderia adhaesiva TaxID=2883244 RepID=UPI001F38386F|nr:sulfotransferase domain-containing protein [Paraburkholderia adhaesiva]